MGWDGMGWKGRCGLQYLSWTLFTKDGKAWMGVRKSMAAAVAVNENGFARELD